ncbi:hypothetical protein AURDEDRAFT_176299 [Auricularia subglabra TFB-10046 SS5]|uniref:Uncharacterized protein n=1 Tax=Auricularia subglabra (strain TFB-10046 / SS5) TaxID=717982 RepID=J0WRN6_AURST|nr:hypothetical protein AURDEDRAFT_176299 [Auricularia subglabra TFB-10046 SS5]
MDAARNALAEAARVLSGAGLDPGSSEVQRQLAQFFSHLPGPSQVTIPPEPPAVAMASASPAASDDEDPQQDPQLLSIQLSDQTTAAVQLRNYNPPRATRFTAEQLTTDPHANKCTRELRCSAFVDHELGAVVEFPETGAAVGESVAHRFRVDPDAKYRPHHNFQYSLGSENSGSRGSSKQVDCLLIVKGEKVRCKSVEYGCESVLLA